MVKIKGENNYNILTIIFFTLQFYQVVFLETSH